MGPMQQAEISRVKKNQSHKQVCRNVQNVQEYYFPIRREILSNCVTDCAVLTIVTMQPAFEPQARNMNLSDFAFEKTNEISSTVVYINTVCAERMRFLHTWIGRKWVRFFTSISSIGRIRHQILENLTFSYSPNHGGQFATYRAHGRFGFRSGAFCPNQGRRGV